MLIKTPERELVEQNNDNRTPINTNSNSKSKNTIDSLVANSNNSSSKPKKTLASNLNGIYLLDLYKKSN